jgi:alkylhydroperoxidase family enzyme
MLDFAVKLTRAPRSMRRQDVEVLRAAGFTDTGIHDIVQITGLFAYYNRLADGLGIELEGLDHP